MSKLAQVIIDPLIANVASQFGIASSQANNQLIPQQEEVKREIEQNGLPFIGKKQEEIKQEQHLEEELKEENKEENDRQERIRYSMDQLRLKRLPENSIENIIFGDYHLSVDSYNKQQEEDKKEDQDIQQIDPNQMSYQQSIEESQRISDQISEQFSDQDIEQEWSEFDNLIQNEMQALPAEVNEERRQDIASKIKQTIMAILLNAQQAYIYLKDNKEILVEPMTEKIKELVKEKFEEYQKKEEKLQKGCRRFIYVVESEGGKKKLVSTVICDNGFFEQKVEDQ